MTVIYIHIFSSGLSLNVGASEVTISVSQASHSIFSLGNYTESHCFIHYQLTSKIYFSSPDLLPQFQIHIPKYLSNVPQGSHINISKTELTVTFPNA